MSGPSGRKMIAADLPRGWLIDPRYAGLSCEAWWMLTHAFMWAIGETNGFIPESALAMLMPAADWTVRAQAAEELVKAEIWDLTEGGWQVRDWEKSQSTVEQIRSWRARNAKDQATYRDRNSSSESRELSKPLTQQLSRPLTKGKGKVKGKGALTPTTEDVHSRAPVSDASNPAQLDGFPATCVAPGCDAPARRACRTCWDHARTHELGAADPGEGGWF